MNLRKIHNIIFIYAVLSFSMLTFSTFPSYGRSYRHILVNIVTLPSFISHINKNLQSWNKLHIQTLVLDLDKGNIYFYERSTVNKFTFNKETSFYSIKKLLLLENRKYLIEMLVYIPSTDRFQIFCRPLNLKTIRKEEKTLYFYLFKLPYSDFRRKKGYFFSFGKYPKRAFYDHMLWMQIKRKSIRDEEGKTTLFSKYKSEIPYLNYSAPIREFSLIIPIEKGRQFSSSEKPEYYSHLLSKYKMSLVPLIKAERIFAILVYTDNIGILWKHYLKMHCTHSMGEKKCNKILKNISDNSVKIENLLKIYEHLKVKFDRTSFRENIIKLKPCEITAFIKSISIKLDISMKNAFFPPSFKINVKEDTFNPLLEVWRCKEAALTLRNIKAR